MTPPPTLTPQKQFMYDMPEVYERLILLALDSDKDFWYAISRTLCLTKDKRFVNDFTSLQNYTIYRAIHHWRTLTAGAPFSPISEGGLLASMFALTQLPAPFVSIELTTKFAQEFLSWKKQYSAEEAYAAVKDTWNTWLTNRKSTQILLDYNRSVNPDINKSLDTLRTAVNEVNKTDDITDQEDWTIDMLAAHEEPVVERILLSTDFRTTNQCLGGGLGKKEHVIFVVPTGGGKTVLACQLAVDLAQAGHGVLLVTTEQHPMELHPRCISNLSYQMGNPIKFAIIKDGLTPEVKARLTDAQLQTVNTADNKIKKYLHFSNYIQNHTLNDLSATVERKKKELADKGVSLDCVILDWIGGALTEHTTDPSKRRLLMIEAAEIMKNIAIRFNVATVSTAQTSKEGIDRKRVTEQHIAECKTLHHSATAACGISAVRLKQDDDEESAVYDNRQHANFFKTRKGKGKYWTILRNFDYQRFEGM